MIENPRAPRRRTGRVNAEQYAWLFMPVSGAILIVLALGHPLVGLLWQGGIDRIDFNYIAQRWSSPVWRIWDLALLWLAELHGGNGMRTIIDDYARRKSTRVALTALLAISMLTVLVVGTYTVVTFNADIQSGR